MNKPLKPRKKGRCTLQHPQTGLQKQEQSKQNDALLDQLNQASRDKQSAFEVAELAFSLIPGLREKIGT